MLLLLLLREDCIKDIHKQAERDSRIRGQISVLLGVGAENTKSSLDKGLLSMHTGLAQTMCRFILLSYQTVWSSCRW